MTWTVADIPSQHGRVAVVTGANGGLGLEVAKALAGAGACVVMAARDEARAQVARDQILAAHPPASLDVVALDLASLASVARAAHDIGERHDRVHLLVDNAGVMAVPEGRTAD